MAKSIELFSNPNFLNDADGWILEQAVLAIDGNGENVVTVLGDIQRTDQLSALSITLDKVPVGRKLLLSFEFQSCEDPQLVLIKSYTFDKEGVVIDAWITQSLAQAKNWTGFSTTFYASTGADSLTIWIQNSGENAISVRNPSLKALGNITVYSVDDCQRIDETFSNIIEVNYSIDVEASKGSKNGIVTFPIPGLYLQQFPISFEIHTVPESALIAYRLSRRSDQINWICEAEVCVSSAITINWQAVVIVRSRPKNKLVKTVALEPPPEAIEWLKSTVCVQANDLAIQKKSRELFKGINDIETGVRRVLQFVHSNQLLHKGSSYASLDAKQGLESGGCCTNAANLVAALLRVQGIAARTVAHIPIWAKWMDMHWIVEYSHPGQGWVLLESSLNHFAPSSNSLVILSVATASDEDRSLDQCFLRSIMPGAPYLSVALLSPELERGWGTGRNYAIEIGKVTGTSEECESLFSEAAKVSLDILESNGNSRLTRKLLAAIGTGSAKCLRISLEKRV